MNRKFQRSIVLSVALATSFSTLSACSLVRKISQEAFERGSREAGKRLAKQGSQEAAEKLARKAASESIEVLGTSQAIRNVGQETYPQVKNFLESTGLPREAIDSIHRDALIVSQTAASHALKNQLTDAAVKQAQQLVEEALQDQYGNILSAEQIEVIAAIVVVSSFGYVGVSVAVSPGGAEVTLVE
ncbi:MAG: hypothetical protein AAF959_22945 [Cyanobacteria bacterium P01_D01_bin.56]